MRPARAAQSITCRLPGLVLLIALVGGAPATTAAAGATGEVRPLQPRGRRLLMNGAARSATFRHLLEQIAATDLIVYVDANPFEGLRLEGALRFAGSGRGVRYVIVWVRPTRFEDRVIATLAHELRHAVEVGAATDVKSQRALTRLYEVIGRSDRRGHLESEAAQAVARQVARELSHPSLQPPNSETVSDPSVSPPTASLTTPPPAVPKL
jgi:hypothetical protein